MSNKPRNSNVWQKMLDALKDSIPDGGALALGWGYRPRKTKETVGPRDRAEAHGRESAAKDRSPDRDSSHLNTSHSQSNPWKHGNKHLSATLSAPSAATVPACPALCSWDGVKDE